MKYNSILHILTQDCYGNSPLAKCPCQTLEMDNFPSYNYKTYFGNFPLVEGILSAMLPRKGALDLPFFKFISKLSSS